MHEALSFLSTINLIGNQCFQEQFFVHALNNDKTRTSQSSIEYSFSTSNHTLRGKFQVSKELFKFLKQEREADRYSYMMDLLLDLRHVEY